MLVPRDDNPSIRTALSPLADLCATCAGRDIPATGSTIPTCRGADWHRDTTWFVGEGNGIGTVIDPRGIYWSSFTGNGLLYAADNRKNIVQTLSVELTSTGILRIPPLPAATARISCSRTRSTSVATTWVRSTSSTPATVTSAATMRSEPLSSASTWTLDADRDSLHQPVTIATDDSLAYVGDAATGKVIRYKRRP